MKLKLTFLGGLLVFNILLSEGQKDDESTGTKLVENWPEPHIKFGQISAVSLDLHGNVFVFHRGNREWDADSFNDQHIFQQRSQGPIINDTIVVLDPFTGSVIRKYGSNMFYLPHGLTVDSENNLWITDVALHQVFKFQPITSNKQNEWKPLITLGTPFTPGKDEVHFCKPTDVAVLKTGDFFVSDGYCNSRIIKYDKKGRLLLEWGADTFTGHISKYSLNLPHALSIAEDKNLLFVADRENGRAVAYNVDSGKFEWQFSSPNEIGQKLFSLSYTPYNGGLLYMVNGPAYYSFPLLTSDVPVQGLILDINKKEIVSVFHPPNNYFSKPHDVVVSYNGHISYVVQLDPHKIWQFHTGEKISGENMTVITTTPLTKEPIREKVEELSHVADITEPLSSSATYFAYILVSLVVLSAFLLVFCMIRKKSGGYRRYEAEGLIQHEDEEDIRLT